LSKAAGSSRRLCGPTSLSRNVFSPTDFDDDALRNAFHGAFIELPANLFSFDRDTTSRRRRRDRARPAASALNLGLPSSAPVSCFSTRSTTRQISAPSSHAEAAGIVGVIISEDSADVFSPKAIRASMGSPSRPDLEDADFDETAEVGQR